MIKFFKVWARGTKSFANSPEGNILAKLFFLFFVIIGLFMAGLNYWVGDSQNFWLGVVLVGFGFVTLIDFRMLFARYNALKKQDKFFGGGL